MKPDAAPRNAWARTVVWLMVLAGILIVLLANAHMMYVAAASQSACIEHLVGGDPAEPGRFSAAHSAC